MFLSSVAELVEVEVEVEEVLWNDALEKFEEEEEEEEEGKDADTN